LTDIIRLGRGSTYVDLPSGEHTGVYSNSMWSGYFMDWRYTRGKTAGVFRRMTVPDYRVRMMFCPLPSGSIGVFLRRVDRANFYHMYYYYDSSTSTKLMRISRVVKGVETVLASTAIKYDVLLYLEGECVGSTLNMLWGTQLPLSVKLTATDTTFTDPGYAGCGQWGEGTYGLSGSWVETLPNSSPVPVPKQWLEVPVTGSGEIERDPYRPAINIPVSEKKLEIIDPDRHRVAVKAGKALGLSEEEAGMLFHTAYPVAVPEHSVPHTCLAPLDRRTGKPSSDSFLVGLLEPVPSGKKLEAIAPKSKKVTDPVGWLREYGLVEEARIIGEMLRG